MAQNGGEGARRAGNGFFAKALIASLISIAPLEAATAQTADTLSRQEASFSIPRGPLSGALALFGRQAGVQISYLPDLASGRQSPGVSGTVSLGEALDRLLQGTGLAFRITGERSVTIVDLQAEAEGSSPLILDVITVEGRGESAYGPVDGYMATRSASATKTDARITDIPASIEVVPRQVIEDQGARRLDDVYENVSGVQKAGDTLNAQAEVLPVIRGFESPTLLRNGLRTTTVGAVDMLNVERVEVLKGPASILYGALEPGGIVNYVTKRPQQTEQYEIKQEFGSYNYLRTSADLTGPLDEAETLAYRLNLAYTNSDSFRDHMELEDIALAPSILWQPTEQTDLQLDFSYLNEKQPYDTGVPLSEDGRPLVSDETFVGDPDLDGRRIKDYVASYVLTHEFNPTWSVRNQFQYHRADNENESIRTRGLAEIGGAEFIGVRYQNEERVQDEYQFVLDTTAKFSVSETEHEVLFGTDLTYQETDFNRFRQNIAPFPVESGLTFDFDPPADQPQSLISTKTRWAGFYAQDHISMLDNGRLKLLLGGRYDVFHEEGVWDDVEMPDIDERALTGRAGLLYQLTNEYSAYVSVSQSFLPQRADVVDVNGMPLDPEEGVQYEAGVKASLLDERLLATASIYEIEKKNVAVWDSATDSYLPGVKERSRGFEFDLNGALTDEINVIANYAYTATKILANPTEPETVGDSFGGVPRHKAALWMTYHFGEASPLNGLGLAVCRVCVPSRRDMIVRRA